MITSNPLVSICVASYNQAEFACLTLESLVAQDYRPLEIIIVDDCSKDDSVSVIRNWIDNYISGESLHKCDISLYEKDINSGVCSTFNTAIKKANGKYIGIIALDDIVDAHKLTMQVDVFEKSGLDVGVIYSDAHIIDEKGDRYFSKFIQWHQQFKIIPEGNIFDILIDGNFIPIMTALFRKDCFDKCGLFDENLIYEDYDFLLRVSKKYRFKYMPYICVSYRIHSNNLHKKLLSIKALETNFKIFYKYKNEDGNNGNKIRNNLIHYINNMAQLKSDNLVYFVELYGKSFSDSKVVNFSLKFKISYRFLFLLSNIISSIRNYL